MIVAQACSPAARAPSDPASSSEGRGDGDAGDALPAHAVVERTPLASLEELDASQPLVAAGLRELARGELTAAEGDTELTHDLVTEAPGDACVRVAFSATSPIGASLVDAGARPYADGLEAPRGALGARGPICFRRGDTVRLRVLAAFGGGDATGGDGATDAADAARPLPAALRVRFVAWSSP